VPQTEYANVFEATDLANFAESSDYFIPTSVRNINLIPYEHNFVSWRTDKTLTPGSFGVISSCFKGFPSY